MKIVFASHSHLSKNLVVGSHHLAREFASIGHAVLHLCTPITLGHFLRNSARERITAWRNGIISHRPNLQEIVPLALLPWQISKHFGLGGYLRSVPFLKSQLRQAGFARPDLLLIDEPRMVGICNLLQARQTIYRATDLYATMRDDPGVNIAEREAIRRSQMIIATSYPVLEHLLNYDGKKPSLVIENGVDFCHFATPTRLPAAFREVPLPRLLYVGALDHRFDFDTINALAHAMPEIQILVGGPSSFHLGALNSSMANVHYLGSVPYRDVPALMQHANIGLLPLNNEPSNRGRSPMKLYEYAAAGLPVVARQTPELERRKDSFVYRYENVGEMVSQIRKILQNPPDRKEISESASAHSWAGKAKQLLQFASGVPL